MLEHNILEIYQMTDLLTDFFNTANRRILTVGGCIGTQLLYDVLDCATAYCPFKKILILEGCQDYVLSVGKKPLPNYLYYLDLFVDTIVDGILPNDPFRVKFGPTKLEFQTVIDGMLLRYYDLVIIHNAHLIPSFYVNEIHRVFPDKIVQIVDPFDLDGELFYGIPVVTDSLQKQSPIISLARHIIGVETRAIDRRIPCSFNIQKLNKRSIGKIDDWQYVTDNLDFAMSIREKQYQSKLHTYQKLFVTSDHVYPYTDQLGGRRMLGKNALLITWSLRNFQTPQFRIYGSNVFAYADVSYTEDVGQHTMHVTPANILMVDEAKHHRYTKLVFVQTEQTQFTRRHYYSLLKNATNVVVCQMS